MNEFTKYFQNQKVKFRYNLIFLLDVMMLYFMPICLQQMSKFKESLIHQIQCLQLAQLYQLRQHAG